jgi:hypothetical protein
MYFDKQNAGHKVQKKKCNMTPLSEVKGSRLHPETPKGDGEFPVLGFSPAH